MQRSSLWICMAAATLLQGCLLSSDGQLQSAPASQKAGGAWFPPSFALEPPGAQTDRTRLDVEPASPPPAPQPHKGIWVWGSSAQGNESELIDWASNRHFTDIFLLIKGVSGTVSYAKLSALLAARTQKQANVRVWAWMVGFADQNHQGWTYLVNDRVSPADASYRAYLAEVAAGALDPSLGEVPEPADGVMLDDTFGWPGHGYGGTAGSRVAAIAASIDAIKARVDAARQAFSRPILLGMAPLPETAVVKDNGTDIVTASANEYGQDFGEIGRRCDWIVPETYRYGFYGGTSSWIGKVVTEVKRELKLEVADASRVQVLPALVLYRSDEDPTPISASLLQADIDAAKQSAGGYSVFRYASGTSNPGSGKDGKDWPTAAQMAVIDP